jgi:hypothetical protein
VNLENECSVTPLRTLTIEGEKEDPIAGEEICRQERLLVCSGL